VQIPVSGFTGPPVMKSGKLDPLWSVAMMQAIVSG
jgi:hypothetical protein